MAGIELASAFVSLLPSFRGGAARISSELGGPLAAASAEQGKRSGGIFGRSFGGAAAIGLTALKGGLFAGAAGLTALGFLGLKTAADLEQAKISFETLLGSGRKADKFLNTLKGFAARTPFELPGLVGTARQLLGVGASAKSVIPTLTAWGDTAGALGLSQFGFERTMRAVTQTMAKGKIQAEELMQITEAGVPIWNILSKALKKPIPEIQKLSSEGKLLAKDVWPLVEKQLNKDFGGSMAKQSKTLTGLWSTFMDTVKIGAADALEPIIPLIKEALPGAMAFLGKALAGAGRGLASLVKFGSQVSNFIGGIVDSFRSGEGATSKFASSVSGIGKFFKDIAPIFVDFGKDLIATVVPGFKSVAEVVTGKLLPALSRFLPVVTPIVKFLLKTVGSALIGALKGAFQITKGVFTAISGLLDIFTGLFTGDWSLLWNGVKTLLSGVWNAILGIIKVALNVGILKAFRVGFSLIGNAAKAGWNLLVRLFKAGLSAARIAVVTGLRLVVGFFKALPGRLLGAVGNLARLLFNKGLSLLRGLLGGAKEGYLAVAKFWIELPGRILKGVGDLTKVLFNAGVDLLKGLINGIKSVAGQVASTVKDAVTGALGAARDALGLGSPSKLFKQYGVWSLEGFIAGIDKLAGKTGLAVAGALSFGKPSAPSTPLSRYRPRPGSGDGGLGAGNVFYITMNGVQDMRRFVEELQKYTKRNPGLRLDVRTA